MTDTPKPLCAHCKAPATHHAAGLFVCETCLGQREPSWSRCIAVALAVLCLFGCARRVPKPGPSSNSATVAAFRQHRTLYAETCREIAQKARGGGFADDRAFLDFHNQASEAARSAAFQQHKDRIQAELGDGKWSNEATAELFERIAGELEAVR